MIQSESHLCDLFDALSNVTRLRIMRIVSSCGSSLPHLTMIAESLGITSTLCSRHVKLLVKVGLLKQYKSSQYLLFEIDPSSFDEVKKFFENLLPKETSHAVDKTAATEVQSDRQETQGGANENGDF